ncbi:MAG TPA: NAD(P)H-hydrate dehydratase [Candidatus Aquabacterium excrementipullorum]|nr:NAD(P)H-hydrate dehydratase [Candidatus Aquabacterium excrementipullorum]
MDELLTCGQMALADAWAMDHGVDGPALMAQAGRAVAHAVQARWSARPVVVLCGPGNNGGDGYVIARHLSEAGWPVRVATSHPTTGLKGEALHHAGLWLASPGGRGGPEKLEPSVLDGAALVVDALYGAGLTRPLGEDVSAVMAEVVARGLPVVAVDVPSGLQGDTGESWGACQAQLTVTFLRKKPGHVLMPGRALCGEIVVADIGIAPQALAPLQVQAWENSPALWLARWSAPSGMTHKYRRGHVIVLGGARMVGAGRLAARAAGRIGAGMTTLAVPGSAWPVYAAGVMSTMVHPLPDHAVSSFLESWTDLLAPSRWAAAVLGPGALTGLPEPAQATLRSLVLTALQAPGGRPLVLDADALTAFEASPELLFDAIVQSESPVVLTPHEGEFQRLFGPGDQGKLERTRDAARRSGAVVLHKGADTVIAAPDGRAAVNTNAPAWLATAGAGDVLAGLIGGLLAQGLPAWKAACAAAWVHGACARAFGPGLLAEDLPEQVPALLRDLWSQP